MTVIQPRERQAWYDTKRAAVVIVQVVLDDAEVVRESRHWATGRRDEATDTDDLAGADLGAFVKQAISIGALAMSAAGGVQQAYNIEALITEVGDRSSRAAHESARMTTEAATNASKAMETASVGAKDAVTQAGESARKAFAANVDAARLQLVQEVNRLVGGEQSELMLRLQPVLETFGRQLHTHSTEQTSNLINKVVRQFDPSDPTSPMSHQIRVLTEQQRAYTEALATQQQNLALKVDELAQELMTKKATALVMAKSTSKGGTYEDQLHDVMDTVAAGLGDEYLRTGDVIGLKSRNKKGDGVLAVGGGDVRVVLEMTDSSRTHWTAYLSEAEQNRGAQASLGLVRSSDQLNGNTFVTLGPRRLIMAFDPEVDDPQLLRAVVQLLRLAAEAAAARVDSGEVATANERIAEALIALERLAKIRKTAGLIRSNASTIDADAGSLHDDLTRLLAQAQSALACVEREVRDDAA